MGSPVSVCRDIRLGGRGSVLGVCDRGVRLAARVASATTTLAALKHYSKCQPKNDALAGVFWVGSLLCRFGSVVLCCVLLCSVPFRPSAAPAPCRATRTAPPPHLTAPTAPRRALRIAPPPASVPAAAPVPTSSLATQTPPPPATQKNLKNFGWVTRIGG